MAFPRAMTVIIIASLFALITPLAFSFWLRTHWDSYFAHTSEGSLMLALVPITWPSSFFFIWTVGEGGWGLGAYQVLAVCTAINMLVYSVIALCVFWCLKTFGSRRLTRKV